MYLVVDQTLDSRDFTQLSDVHLHSHWYGLVLTIQTYIAKRAGS